MVIFYTESQFLTIALESFADKVMSHLPIVFPGVKIKSVIDHTNVSGPNVFKDFIHLKVFILEPCLFLKSGHTGLLG